MEAVDPISDYKLNYALMNNCGEYIEDHCEMEQGKSPSYSPVFNLDVNVGVKLVLMGMLIRM